MDESLHRNMEQTCEEMGMSIYTAFMIFAHKVTREKRIPFEVSAEVDPFYSYENMNRLKTAIADINAGINSSERELIEVEDD